jgi:hypothetical protein
VVVIGVRARFWLRISIDCICAGSLVWCHSAQSVVRFCSALGPKVSDVCCYFARALVASLDIALPSLFSSFGVCSQTAQDRARLFPSARFQFCRSREPWSSKKWIYSCRRSGNRRLRRSYRSIIPRFLLLISMSLAIRWEASKSRSLLRSSRRFPPRFVPLLRLRPMTIVTRDRRMTAVDFVRHPSLLHKRLKRIFRTSIMCP